LQKVVNSGSVIGQTLDNKYKIEKELGKGGMGTVYLATHVGTERPVAVKIIASEFMQRVEFIERFRREARAAGRLRHPNVVNVTDFGFANANDGTVAYLVMEYLDGCTLGEILEEEKHLPLSWTIDILEQVCSAVEEAHKQGIIHRDLKPDNIWLEPNQRGGYTVKVLDFGIAKLEEQISDADESTRLNFSSAPTENFKSKTTVADQIQTNTIAENHSHTAISESETVALNKNSNALSSESATLIQPLEAIDLEPGTKILPAIQTETVSPKEADSTGTKLISQDDKNATKLFSEQIDIGKSLTNLPSTTELTRVGAVLGTPLYMSPEQCRGEKLSVRSDVYSLGVIAYQMLSGKTPFSGDYKAVMKAHEEIPPPALEAKKIPKKVKRLIHASLAKKHEERPRTAEAFASELRAQSEGISVLLRRAFSIYSEHLPKFLGLTILIFLPLAAVTILDVASSFLYADEAISLSAYLWLKPTLKISAIFVGIFCGSLIIGTTTWIVTQFLAMPLRPVTIRPALRAAQKKWKALVGTGLLSTVLMFLGLIPCGLGFPLLSVLFALVSPVVMMENLRGRAALKRSKTLVMRSLGTTVAAMSIMFIVPAIMGILISFFMATAVKSFSETKEKVAVVRQEIEQSGDLKNTAEKREADKGLQIKFGTGNEINIKEENDGKPQISGINGIAKDMLTTILTLPLQILAASLSAIIIALLYMKTRLAGGESMQDLLAQFEETDRQRSNWQRSIRQRLEQSGKQTSKS
jgi:serine/threonine protein kinase